MIPRHFRPRLALISLGLLAVLGVAGLSMASVPVLSNEGQGRAEIEAAQLLDEGLCHDNPTTNLFGGILLESESNWCEENCPGICEGTGYEPLCLHPLFCVCV